MSQWRASDGFAPPFSFPSLPIELQAFLTLSHTQDMYEEIDVTRLGDTRWEPFTIKYEGIRPDHDVPDWMMAQYEVWFRDPLTLVHNMLSNPDFKDEVDYAPFQEYDRADNRQFQDIMSGNWAWEQCVGSITCR